MRYFNKLDPNNIRPIVRKERDKLKKNGKKMEKI